MMSEATWALLRRLLVSDYARLSRQLQRLTGSADLADEALQDTYLRLAEGGEISDHLASPQKYLFKMALNAARKILRKDRARGRYIEIVDTLDLEVADEAPSPETEAFARAGIDAVKTLLAAMPERRRDIFVLALFDDIPLGDIARRYGIGLRMVQLELKAARAEIEARLMGANVVDFATSSRDAL